MLDELGLTSTVKTVRDSITRWCVNLTSKTSTYHIPVDSMDDNV